MVVGREEKFFDSDIILYKYLYMYIYGKGRCDLLNIILYWYK